MSEQKIELSLTKIIAGVITAVLIGAVGSAFGLIRLADSNAIRIAATEAQIESLESNTVSRNEWQLVLQRLDRMDTKLDQLLSN